MKLSALMTALAIRDTIRSAAATAATTTTSHPREDLDDLIKELEADLSEHRTPKRATIKKVLECLRRYREFIGCVG